MKISDVNSFFSNIVYYFFLFHYVFKFSMKYSECIFKMLILWLKFHSISILGRKIINFLIIPIVTPIRCRWKCPTWMTTVRNWPRPCTSLRLSRLYKSRPWRTSAPATLTAGTTLPLASTYPQSQRSKSWRVMEWGRGGGIVFHSSISSLNQDLVFNN